MSGRRLGADGALPFLPAPRAESLVNVGSTDLLEFYEKMRSTAIQLSQAYGDDHHERMVEALRVETAGEEDW